MFGWDPDKKENKPPPESQQLDFSSLSNSERFREILKARPTEEQLLYTGEPSLKAARVLGEAKIATNSVAGLAYFGEDGSYDSEAVRRANAELIIERERRRVLARSALEASLGKPSKEQLDYPTQAQRKPVSIKAMQVLGDEDLAFRAKKVILDAKNPALKALKVLGIDLAAPKAQKVLGSTKNDGEARAMADKHWLEEMNRRYEEFTKQVLLKRPHESLRSLPLGHGPVAKKALRIFGDEELEKKSLRALKHRAPPKAIRLLGEASLAGSKAERLTGCSCENVPSLKRKQNSLLNYRKLFRFVYGEAELI